MRMFGILGGMSWEFIQYLYGLINCGVVVCLGGLYSVLLLLYSVDFVFIVVMQVVGDWVEVVEVLGVVGVGLWCVGVEVLLIVINIMYFVVSEVECVVGLLVLYIVDVMVEVLCVVGVCWVGLLVIGFMMEQGFYCEWMRECFGIEFIVFDQVGCVEVYWLIYEELCCGCFELVLCEVLCGQVVVLVDCGVQVVILGCIELGLLLLVDVFVVLLLFDFIDLQV